MQAIERKNAIIKNSIVSSSINVHKYSNIGLRSHSYVKSPLNYIGGKYKLLNQILPLFPQNINYFVDLFTGGCNVGINVHANNILCNDNLIYLIDLFNQFQNISVSDIITHIECRISQYNLSLINEEGYNSLRELYNNNRNPLDLFVLVAYSFNHQIRFNNNHKFNNPFGRERSSFNEVMKYNLISFIERLQKKNISFSCNSFEKFDLSTLTKNDFVYCDPPYLITTGTYNDGKRGFKGWNIEEEYKLLTILDTLNVKGVQFALSNVLTHKGKENEILKNWITKNGYNINNIKANYANSSYHTHDRSLNSSIEVLITNYKPIAIQATLF
ncbi:MAG: Dam family site-specific DNA-(adenine-N6)-methyltransferase [Muribaculaceae bacterium]